MRSKILFGVLCLLAAILMGGSVVSAAEKINTDPKKQLPDPDTKPLVTNKPVKVYILAGQSNMVGMGNLSGARCRYSGIYLTADPAAPKGPMYIYPVGNYKISAHGVYVSADPKAGKGAGFHL